MREKNSLFRNAFRLVFLFVFRSYVPPSIFFLSICLGSFVRSFVCSSVWSAILNFSVNLDRARRSMIMKKKNGRYLGIEASYLLEVEVTFCRWHRCLLLPEDGTGAPVVHHALWNTEQKQRWLCGSKWPMAFVVCQFHWLTINVIFILIILIHRILRFGFMEKRQRLFASKGASIS